MIKTAFVGLSLAATLFSACGSIPQEDRSLKGHYIYRSKGLNKRFIDSDDPLGRNMIFADVLEHAENDSFIIVRQRPSSKYLKYHLGFYLYARYIAYTAWLRDTGIVNTQDGRFMKGFIETDSVNYRLFKQRNVTERNNTKDKGLELAIADSIINHDPYYKQIAYGKDDNYWIIRLSKDSLLGPFSKTGYLQERKVLAIPGGLTLGSDE